MRTTKQQSVSHDPKRAAQRDKILKLLSKLDDAMLDDIMMAIIFRTRPDAPEEDWTAIARRNLQLALPTCDLYL